MISEERIQTTMRFRQGRYRAVSEAAELLGGLSRETTVHMLLGKGLAAVYEELGIAPDPAVTAAELLRVLAETWAADMSDEEIAAMETTRKTLERIAQVRGREK